MSWLSDNLPGLASIVGGGVATIAGAPEYGIPLMSGGLGYMGQESANETNTKLASDAADRAQAQAIQQEEYQTYMSNTAYQRQAADMKAAGINPIMAGVQGGASTPSGAAGAVPVAHVENALGAGLSSAAEVSRTMSTLKQADAAAKAQQSQATLNDALGAKAVQDTMTGAATARQYTASSKALESQLNAISAESGLRTKDAVFKSQNYLNDALAERLGKYSNSAKSFTNLINPLSRSPQSDDNGYNINGAPVPF